MAMRLRSSPGAAGPPAPLPETLPPLLPTTLACEFSCSACSAVRRVAFHDPNACGEPEPMPQKGRWAQEQAYRETISTMDKLARSALAVARCPACHRRDALAVRRALLSSLWPVATLAPALFMGGVIATASLIRGASRLLPVVVGLLLVLGAAPLLIQRRHRQILAEADAATEFLPEGTQ